MSGNEVEKEASPSEIEEPSGATSEEKEAKLEIKIDKKVFKDQFVSFAKFGDKTADGKAIKLSQSDKWFKQAKLFEDKSITTTDTGIAFRKVGKNTVKLSFVDWNKYLDEISKTKNLNSDEVRSQLIDCGKPGTSGTTAVTKSAALDRLTDPSKYGGTHKERFDASGKGKGKPGRVDPKSDGYVSGYKNKGAFHDQKS